MLNMIESVRSPSLDVSNLQIRKGFELASKLETPTVLGTTRPFVQNLALKLNRQSPESILRLTGNESLELLVKSPI